MFKILLGSSGDIALLDTRIIGWTSKGVPILNNTKFTPRSYQHSQGKPRLDKSCLSLLELRASLPETAMTITRVDVPMERYV